MDYQILRAELENDPLGIGYAAMTDDEAAAALTAPALPARRHVPVGDVMAVAYRTGVYTRLIAAQRSPQTPVELYAVIASLLDLKDARFDAINLDEPASRAMFATLGQAGLLSVQEAAAFDALASAVVSRAEQLGLSGVSVADVHNARVWG